MAALAQDGVSSSPSASLHNNEIYKSPEYTRAEKAALRLVARAEQCSLGLTQKLEKRGHDAVCVSAVISRLSEQKLIDDNRFARLWLESRMHLTRSPRRLLSSLCARGIDHDDAETALKTVLDEEAELSLLARFVKKHSRKFFQKEENLHLLKYLIKSEGFSQKTIKRFFDEE